MEEKQLVYIVEDDTSMRELEVYALKNASFEVSGFADGRELMTAMEGRVPDIILLDIMLPNEDGLDILSKIRNSALYCNIPVIMVTAKTSRWMKLQCSTFFIEEWATITL